MKSRLILVTEGLEGQTGGVQRISRAILKVSEGLEGQTIIWSSNDVGDKETQGLGDHGARSGGVIVECFEKRYMMMGWKALADSLPESCEKIFCFHLALSPIACILGKRLGVPFDVFLHGVEAWGRLKPMQCWALKHVKSFIANSRYTLDRFRKEHPEFSGCPGRVLQLGLNEEFVNAAEKRGPPSFDRMSYGATPCSPPQGEAGDLRRREEDKAPFFLTVTRLDESYKGIRNLIDAFAVLHKDFPQVQLRIVGDGVMRNELEEYSKSLNLSSSVLFLGNIADDQLSDIYSESLAFVLLSEGEGFGIVFLEAMFHGVPCISTTADAVQELIKDGETGFAIEPGNKRAATTAMRKLMEDADLRNRLGKEARKRVLARFMPEHFYNRLRECLKV